MLKRIYGVSAGQVVDVNDTAQIAAELGLTERGVEGRLYRLRDKMRRLMGGEDG